MTNDDAKARRLMLLNFLGSKITFFFFSDLISIKCTRSSRSRKDGTELQGLINIVRILGAFACRFTRSTDLLLASLNFVMKKHVEEKLQIPLGGYLGGFLFPARSSWPLSSAIADINFRFLPQVRVSVISRCSSGS